jgi:hypothetical protein
MVLMNLMDRWYLPTSRRGWWKERDSIQNVEYNDSTRYIHADTEEREVYSFWDQGTDMKRNKRNTTRTVLEEYDDI